MKPISDYYFLDHKLKSTKDMIPFDSIDESAVYEVIKISDGVPMFFDAHFERMKRSALFSGITMEKDKKEVLEEIKILVEKNGLDKINVKLVNADIDGACRFFTYFIKTEYPGPMAYEKGIHTILFRGERENPNIKTIKGSFRKRVKKELEKAKAYEALLVDKNGYITEGSRSNIFFIKDGKVHTPPSHAVLKGVTRSHVIEICTKLSMEVIEDCLHKDEINIIEGAFITGTTVDVLPIASIEKTRLSSVSCALILKIIKIYHSKLI